MNKARTVLLKIRRIAVASFKNALRLHEDSVLMFENDRIPSALHTSILAIEEIGKYFMHEDVWFHNRHGAKWTIQDMQKFLSGTYSHTSKQRWFAGHADSRFISKPLLKILLNGDLERIKQKAIYVGIPRKGRNIDLEKRLSTPSSISRRQVENFITMFNDFLVDLAVGVRKGVYSLDIPEIDDWLAEPEFELHFVMLWPKMRPVTKKQLARMQMHDDAER